MILCRYPSLSSRISFRRTKPAATIALNFFPKGIFVNIERPFSINDWITVDDKTGYVENITWRSTRIRTFQNTEVIIPNEIVADSILTNWSKQDKEKMSEGFHIFNKLYFHPSHDPENISKLLYNALKKAKPVDGREQLNLQWVRFIGANEFGLEFVVAFDCTKRILKNSMQDSVMMEIHKTLRHAGVQMSAGKLYGKLEEDIGLHALDTHRSREDFEKRQVSEFNPYNESVKNRVLLQKIPIFMSLNSGPLMTKLGLISFSMWFKSLSIKITCAFLEYAFTAASRTPSGI